MHLKFILAAILVTSLGACESAELAGPSGGDSKKQSSGAQADDTAADEPVMVGGAHLTCVDLSSQSLTAQGKDIGCAVNDTRTGTKVDLGSYETKWVVVDNSQSTVPVQSEMGEPTSRYHMRFKYDDETYLQHTVKVKITSSRSGVSREYLRQLAVLDTDFSYEADTTHMSLTVGFLSREEVSIPFNCSNFGLNSNKSSTPDRSSDCDISSSVTSTFVDALFNMPCFDGKLMDTYSFPRAGETDVSIKLGTEACILNTPKISPQPANYGCYKVPMMGKRGEFYIAIVEGRKVGPSMMAQLAYNYSCKISK